MDNLSHDHLRKKQRDEWMNESNFVPTISKEEMRGEKKKKQLLCTVEKPGQHGRELNPYWKDGGTGMPTQDSTKKSTSNTSGSQKLVGDAGLSWLRRAYQRIEEQAKEENKSLEEVAAGRWGSLEKLESLLKEAEAKARENKHFDNNNKYWKTGSSSRHSKTDRRENKYSRGKPYPYKSRDSYNEKHHSTKDIFQKPYEKSEESTQQRAFCWESEKVAPVKRNWMKKDPVPNHSSTTLAENEDNVETNEVIEKPPAQTAQDCLLSDKEMNELGAKLIKAEMLGRKTQAEQLKSQLDAARKARENAAKESGDESVVLFRTNDKGFCQPLKRNLDTGSSELQETKKKSKREQSWLLDNDKFSLKQMFEREKMTTAEDKNIEFAKLFVKSGADDDDGIDGFMTNNIKEESLAKQEQRDRNQAIHEHTKMSAMIEKCQYCLDSNYNKKHLIIAIGIKIYLSLPSTQSLTDGHCFIIPMQHIAAGTLLDEDVWAEIKIFRKGLNAMFEEMGKVAIFMETSMYHRRHPHTIIECVPVPKEDGDMAPCYFKKAIMESEEEWTNNKKLVDLYKKDLLHSVPKGLPYFSVEFGLGGGFAHVIEDEKLFPTYFGKEIIGGFLEMEQLEWRKAKKETPEEQRKKINLFRELWKKYDWTEKIKER